MMKQILTIWLLLLSTLIASALPHKCPVFSDTLVHDGEPIGSLAFDCDGVMQGKVDYDDMPKGDLGYDRVLMLPTNESGIASCVGRSLFGNFSEFLAAKTAAQDTGTILWSGPGAKNAAEWLANNTGGTTLEMTQLGARTELATVGMDI